MKKKIVISVCALTLLFLVFAFVYHLPRRIEWSGTASSIVNGYDVEAEVTLDLKEWRGFFRAPYYTGSVIIDGERFEDIHDYGVFSDNPFIPVSLKEDFGGRQLEVYNRFVRVNRWEGGGVTVWLLDGRGVEDPPWSTNRVFCINLKASV